MRAPGEQALCALLMSYNWPDSAAPCTPLSLPLTSGSRHPFPDGVGNADRLWNQPWVGKAGGDDWLTLYHLTADGNDTAERRLYSKEHDREHWRSTLRNARVTQCTPNCDIIACARLETRSVLHLVLHASFG